jgi:HTH-type transcriptional regulator/antitoxin HigA
VEEMTSIQISGAAEAWQNLQHHIPFSAIHSEQQYEQALEALDALLDASNNDEKHPLADMLETLGELIHIYEEKHLPVDNARGVDVIHLLMQEHQLAQADLPEIGSQGIVSEVLSGKRELNLRMIRRLSDRFHMNPKVFI